MDDFQKQLQRLKRNPVFAKAFDKRRTEAEVAFQIRRLREAKGWSQKDLAKKVGCSQQAVSAVEQAGYKRHSLQLLRRIAAVLDADDCRLWFHAKPRRLPLLLFCHPRAVEVESGMKYTGSATARRIL
jgi:DNA-binding XRE family transcriptional regulator